MNGRLEVFSLIHPIFHPFPPFCHLAILSLYSITKLVKQFIATTFSELCLQSADNQRLLVMQQSHLTVKFVSITVEQFFDEML